MSSTLVQGPRRSGTPRPVRAALRSLAERLARHAPLPSLLGADYGRAHACFEARSDQRPRLESHLAACLPPAGPLQVLSVGCGDGALDAALARSAVQGDLRRAVRWQGVEPLASSAAEFLRAVRAVPAPGLVAGVEVTAFADLRPADRFDVVTVVHCLYYVPDVLAALHQAARLLAPDGQVLVAHAPRHGLNELGALLAPQRGGVPMWWSETTRSVLEGSGLLGRAERLTAHVDLTACRDLDDPVGHDVLDFTVQARLPAALRPAVLDVLEAMSLPGEDLLVEHPVDLWSLRPTPHHFRTEEHR